MTISTPRNKKKARAPIEPDPDFQILLRRIHRFSPKFIAEKARFLVGENTIYNWKKGKVKRPQHYTMQAAAKAVGLIYKLMEDK